MSTVKKYLISSLDTFIAGFLIGIAPAIESLTIANLSRGAIYGTIIGIVLVGVRGGVKALREYFTSKLASRA